MDGGDLVWSTARVPAAEVSAEPVERVGRAWAWTFNLAWVGVMVGLFGPIQVLLPDQAQALAPQHKEYVLGVVTALGAAAALLVNPLWGALSDRTRSRFGRRLPWIAVGTVAGALGLVALASAKTVLVMAIAWFAVQALLGAPWAALSAAVPDQVPERQRGTVAGWLGFAQIVGVLLAIGLANVFPGPAGYLACAVVMLLVVAPFVALRRDSHLVGELPSWSWRAFARGFWISPRRHPDFGWAWVTRFLINLANTLALVYLLYFLRDALLRGHAELDLLILGGVNSLGTVAAVVVSGVWSDRVGRRRPFVVGAGLVQAVSALAVAVAPSMPTLYVVAFTLGVGFGVFTSVDFALITQVLPDRLGAGGKDLGVLNIASALPQVLAPAIAAPVVTALGGYSTLFGLSAATALAGALLVGRIRTVN